MKKLLVLFIFLFFILPVFQANAFTSSFKDDIYITEAVNDDFYTAGGRINISAPINGDLVIAGGEINVRSDVKNDLTVAGGDITIYGNIGDDVRIVGGTVRIRGNVAGDLVVGAGDVQVDSGVVISGDLVVGAGRIILDGKVMGMADIRGGGITLNGLINKNAILEVEDFINPTNKGVINGNVEYKGNQINQNIEKSTKGEATFKKYAVSKEMKSKFIGFISTYLLIKIIGLFVFSSLIYLYFENLFKSISDNLRTKTGSSFLHGLLILGGIPIIIILLFISVIGIPFAIFGIFVYIFIFVFLEIINVMVFSSLFIEKYNIDKMYKKLLIIFGLTLLFGLINGIDIIVGFFTIGAILIKKLDLIKEIKFLGENK